MISLYGLYGLLGFSFLCMGILAFDYELVIRDEDIFQPCPEYPDNTIHSFFDTSNLQFKTLDNDSVHCVGTVEIIQTIKPDTLLQCSLQIYKKNRAAWVNTIYNFYRPDTCRATFDPTEIWYRFVKSVPEEQKRCPIYTGQKFTFDAVSDLTVSLPDPRLAGDYKATIMLKFEDETSPTLCTEFFVSVYRK